MPFIDLKVTVPVADNSKEIIKSELGKAITTLHKSEAYLMVGISDNYDLWLGGSKIAKGAYVSVSLYGSASSSDYNTLTGQICDILGAQLGIKGDNIYVTYHPVEDWGWNGRNF